VTTYRRADAEGVMSATDQNEYYTQRALPDDWATMAPAAKEDWLNNVGAWRKGWGGVDTEECVNEDEANRLVERWEDADEQGYTITITARDGRGKTILHQTEEVGE
jgi:hypothetical protein